MRHQRYFNRVNTRNAWNAQEFMQRIGRTPDQEKYYNRDGSVKQGYSTIPSQQNSNPVYTHRGYNSAPQNVYKMDTPQAAPAQTSNSETTNTTKNTGYTPTPIDVGQVDTNVPTQTNQNTQEPFDTTPYDNIISQLSDQIASITQAMQTNTTNFNNQMAEYGKRFDEQQATYDKNLTSMRNTLLASNTTQREPVLGIKGAADKGNAQIQQLARQGMKGTFSREGLRIKNINV